MRKIFLALIIGCSLLQIAKGQTSAKVVEDYHKEKIHFFADWWQNPAMRFAYPVQQFTDVSLNYQQKDNEAFAIQKGSDLNAFTFRANSFFRDTTQLYYGKAAYNKWNIEGYKWNTVADVDLLQPYIVADTIGGKMYNEQYAFAGGYARRFSKISVGAFASYRAMTAYKKKDPRPKSTVSHLKVNLGGTWAMSAKYTLGTSLLFNKYTQDHHISIFKDGSGAMLYYLRGLGIADERFSTGITDKSGSSNKYRQKGYGATVSLFPAKQRGFLGTLSVRTKDLELLKEKGPIMQKISTLQTNFVKGNLGYKFNIKTIGCIAKIYGHYGEQSGKEYIYRTNSTVLSIVEKYKSSNYIAGFEALGAYDWENVKSLTKLSVAYNSQEERYGNTKKLTSSTKDVGNFSINLQENLLWHFEKSTFFTKVGLGYRHNLNKNLRTGTLTADRAKATLVLPDYLFETNSCLAGQLSLRYDYQLNETFCIYGKGLYNYANYEDLGSRQHYQITVGLAF